MASTSMGASRGQPEGWSQGYRFLVSPMPGQVPYAQLPIPEGQTNDSVVLQDYGTGTYGGLVLSNQHYPSVASLPTSSSQVLHHKTDGSVGVQVTQTQDYYPAFTEVQNTVFGYNNLEHYGTTNVGKAVAMSLSSMEGCNTMGQMQETRAGENQAMCSGMIVGACQNQGEFLFSELLGTENELPLLDVCKQNEGTSNYYKIQDTNTKEGEETRSDNMISTEFPQMGGGDSIYLNIDHVRKDDGNPADTYSTSPNAVQKKYKFYGKGRPYELEGEQGKIEPPTDEGYQSSAATFLPESHFSQRGLTSAESHQLPQYHYELNLLNRTTPSYGQETSLSTTNYQYAVPSGSGYQPYPTTSYPEDTRCSSERSDDSDSQADSCKSDDRVSKDEKRAKELRIPLTTLEIISLPIDEFNEKISKFELTDPQLSLIRDIRRRGKNKVAAQNCRKRKLDQIFTLQREVHALQMEKVHLQTQQETLFKRRMGLNDKYIYVCQLINNFNSKSEQPVVEDNVQYQL